MFSIYFFRSFSRLMEKFVEPHYCQIHLDFPIQPLTISGLFVALEWGRETLPFSIFLQVGHQLFLNLKGIFILL